MVNISKISRYLLFCTMLVLMSQPTHAMFSDKKSLAIPLIVLGATCAIIGTYCYKKFILDKPDKPLPELHKEILANISTYVCHDLITYIESTKFPLRHILQGHTGIIVDANFSPNSKEIITVSTKNTVIRWYVETGKQIHKLQHTYFVAKAKFNPNGEKFYYSSWNNQIIVWDIKQKTWNNQIRVWDIKQKTMTFLEEPKTRQARTEQEHKNRMANFKLILSKNNLIPPASNFFYLNGNVVEIKNSKTKKTMKLLKGHTDTVCSAKFNQDKKLIITASMDNTAKIWDAQTCQTVHTLHHSNSVFGAKFRPNSEIVATISNKTVRIWNANTGKLLRTLKKHLTIIKNFKFSQNGQTFISSSYEGEAKVYEAETWRKFLTIRNPHKLKFSPDSEKIAIISKDNTVKILDNEWKKNNLNWLRSDLLPHQAEIIRRASLACKSDRPLTIRTDSEESRFFDKLSHDKQKFLEVYLGIKRIEP